MLGWMIVFGLIAVVGAALGFLGIDSAMSLRAVGAVFSVLFVICGAGRMIRHYA